MFDEAESMTTFILMLIRNAGALDGAAKRRIPKHEFVAGGADYPEFENTILPAHRETRAIVLESSS